MTHHTTSVVLEKIHLDESSQSIFEKTTEQTPWWIVSILFHGLVIALASLISVAVNLDDNSVQMVTEISYDAIPPHFQSPDPKPRDEILNGPRATETDPNGPAAFKPIIILDEAKAFAELEERFQTDNPDLTYNGGARGNLLAEIFGLREGSVLEPGGGGTSGSALSTDLIGLAALGTLGAGRGEGGGDGGGYGIGHGPGNGTWGDRIGAGHKIACAKQRGGGRETEDAVKQALQWLAYHQEPDGRWDASKFGAIKKVDTAVTALALLAFLGAGHTEKQGEWKPNVHRAVSWLKSKQAPDGLILDKTENGGHGPGYSAAIASLAIAEAAGMGNVKETRLAAQRAVKYCTDHHQQGEGSEKIAWRYAPKSPGDISVTGWFVMALKSARVAGLSVDDASFEGAKHFLDLVEIKDANNDSGYPASRYSYQPGKNGSYRRSAIGNLCRQFLGAKKEDLESSVQLFVKEGGVPQWNEEGRHVDLYYWYYGTLSVFQQGPESEVWKRWNEGMKNALTGNQCRVGDDSGSWNPVGDYSQEWGRVGQTALAALCLEVYYRYQLVSK